MTTTLEMATLKVEPATKLEMAAMPKRVAMLEMATVLGIVKLLAMVMPLEIPVATMLEMTTVYSRWQW